MTAPGALLAGKYELTEIAGKGGMATVWRAKLRGAAGFSRPVAIKMMLPRLCNDPHFVALFVEEARVCSQLSHPNVTQIYDFGADENGVHYLAMEWVEGLDLLDYARSFIDRGYFTPWAAIAMIGLEVLKGLHAAHSHLGDDGRPSPIFHRDVTPHNILLGINGVVKLSDFGLAKAGDRGSMTQPHVVKGKISYTAPEMTRGVKANERTDLFSLGVSLWEALAGRKMFDAPTPMQIVRQIQAWNVPPLDSIRRDIPPELLKVIELATAREPEERFASAQQMARELARMLPPVLDVQRLGRSIADARVRLKANEQVVTAEELGSALQELSTAHVIKPQPAAPARQTELPRQPVGAAQPAFSLPSPGGAARAARIATGSINAPVQPQPAARQPAASAQRPSAPISGGYSQQQPRSAPSAQPPEQQRTAQPQAHRPTTATGLPQPSPQQLQAATAQPSRPITAGSIQKPSPQQIQAAQQQAATRPAPAPQTSRPITAMGMQQPTREQLLAAQQQAARAAAVTGAGPQTTRPVTAGSIQQPTREQLLAAQQARAAAATGAAPQATRPVTAGSIQKPSSQQIQAAQQQAAATGAGPQATRPVTAGSIQQPTREQLLAAQQARAAVATGAAPQATRPVTAGSIQKPSPQQLQAAQQQAATRPAPAPQTSRPITAMGMQQPTREQLLAAQQAMRAVAATPRPAAASPSPAARAPGQTPAPAATQPRPLAAPLPAAPSRERAPEDFSIVFDPSPISGGLRNTANDDSQIEELSSLIEIDDLGVPSAPGRPGAPPRKP